MVSISACKKDNNETNNDIPETGIEIGQFAPNFTLTDKNGINHSLSDYKGKLVLVNFWASWCHFCRAENPQLVQLYEEYSNSEFEIIGVSFDTDSDNWIRGITEDNITYVQVSDLLGFESPLASVYDVTSIPKMILLDTEGRVILVTSKASAVADKVYSILK